jgi:hypothetical protein
MALRLDDLIEVGEINCTRYYTIFGFIKLRGQEAPLYLQLTGNPDPDLRGKRFRFEPRVTSTGKSRRSATELNRIAREQIGPPGDFTAARQVRVFDCSVEEFYRRSKLGESVPTEWKPCLYLEWFSQNGRVVIELPDPILEFLEADDRDGGTETVDAIGELSDAGMETVDADDQLPWIDDAEESSADYTEQDDLFESVEDADEEEDPYGLLPDDLQEHFDAQASETDRHIRDDNDKPQDILEAELMDELIEGGSGEPLASIVEDIAHLPAHTLLDDSQVETALKTLLSQMALFGIALDVCEHFTPRDSYRYLMETILPHELGHRELRHTQWVQHFSTWEDCEQCAREFDREWEARQRREQSGSDGSEAATPE